MTISDAALDRLQDAMRCELHQRESGGGRSPGSDAPLFPLDALPSAMKAYVDAAAKSLSVPPEMVAVPMLALAGSLIGNRLHVVLKHSWREYPSLFVAVVSRPGTAKTPALGLAQWPLDALQKRAHTAHQAAILDHERDLTAWQATDAALRGPKPRAPKPRDFFSTDITIEALVGILGSNPSAAIIRDEIGGWVAAMDQYRGGKGSDRQQYLSLWSAGTIKADRKTGGSIYVRHPVCCVVGGIQPDLASQLHNAAAKRDGFVERILPIVPEVGVSRWADDAPTPGQYQDVFALHEALDMELEKLLAANVGDAITGATGIGVHLHPDALDGFKEWLNENANLIEAADGIAAGFYSKLPAHLARLALILHALHHPSDPRLMLSAETMGYAIDLGDFFRDHIGRFLALLNAAVPSPFPAVEGRVLRQIRKLRNQNGGVDGGWVSRSDIYNGIRNVRADALTVVLDTLLERGVIEHHSQATSRKPIDYYRILNSDLSDLSPVCHADTATNQTNPITPNGVLMGSDAPNGVAGDDRWTW